MAGRSVALNILVIDGQGGGVGRQLVEKLKKEFPASEITAVGTNAMASQAMMKAGADHVATGENAVVVCCRTADVIIGPVGIVVADALYGEITPTMARAVGQSTAKRILLPMNQCQTVIVGVSEMGLDKLIQSVIAEIKK